MQPRLPDSVEHWPLDRLRAYARNPRTHSDAQVAQIAASIVEFGWTNPVLVAGDGTVIAGSEVSFHNGASGFSFMELVASGVVQTTTIALSGIAVHSRHTIIENELVPAQHHGRCN